MKSVVLCADETSLMHPEYLGLEGEAFPAQPWLRTFSDASEARDALRAAQEVQEVWVASNNEVEPINLAAVLKSDRPDRPVFLVADSLSGSLMSRVKTARIDGVISSTELVSRYAARKREDAQTAQDQHAQSVRVQIVPEGGLVQGTYEEPDVPPQMDARDVRRSTAGRHSAGPRSGRHAAEAEAGSPGKHIGTVREDALGKHALVGGVPLVQPSRRDTRPLSLTEQAMLAVQGYENRARRHEDARSFVPPVRAGGEQAGDSASIVVQQNFAKQAFLLPVVSGSGGSGKSTLAVMTALIAYKAGLKTLLVDLDLQFGDMLDLLGYNEALSVDALLAAPSRVRHLQPQDGGPALLSAPSHIEQAEELVGKTSQLLDLVLPLFDVVVVNTGSFWTELQAVLLERCSRALFVVDQRPSSLRGCMRALDLCTRCGIAASPLVFAVNKCGKQALYSSIDVSCALNGASAKEIAWGGSEVEELLAAGRAAALLEERNPLVESLGAMLVDLIPGMPALEPDKLGPGRGVPFLRMLMGGSTRSKDELLCR